MSKTNEVRLIDANALNLDDLPAYYGTSISEGAVKEWIDEAPTITLNTLRDAIYEDAVAHGLWFERDDCPTTCVEMIQDEVSELDTAAMEWEDDICDNNDDFVEELADVIIMSLSVAGKLGIDIDEAVRRKMQINRERPWKHGKEDACNT